jgi:KamA family protein
MLEDEDFEQIYSLVAAGAPRAQILAEAREIQMGMNPHPAGQSDLNVPKDAAGEAIPGLQHKYRETVLFFPMAGQTCHAYCTYCFRWPQFVGLNDMKFASREADGLVEYLKRHPEVTSVLITGGDPLIMRTAMLRRYLEPLLDPALENLTSIRIGTKAPAWWPYRFTHDDGDGDSLLRLFEEVRAAGKSLALMAHYSHPVELESEIAQLAVRRIQDTGAVVRCQAPLIRHVNDDADSWREMWKMQVQLGAVPYYMFVERDTGARNYFEVPLARALEVFQSAYRQVTGLARTVRGPSMSATPGKVVVNGVAEIAGEKVFVLKLLQARNPEWVNRIFFAKYDEQAVWLDDLQPALGASEFFYESEMDAIEEAGHAQVWSEDYAEL